MEKLLAVPEYSSTSLMMSAKPFQDEVKFAGIAFHAISFDTVSMLVRLKDGRSLPSAASRRNSAGVCKIESKPHLAMPLRNRPSRRLQCRI